jgi:hypothetical protein
MRTARMLEAEWRQVLWESVSTGTKGKWLKYWARLGSWISACYGPFYNGARLGCWISACYGPFYNGARFETYEPFISLIFIFFSGGGEPRILNQWIRGHTCTYIFQNEWAYISQHASRMAPRGDRFPNCSRRCQALAKIRRKAAILVADSGPLQTKGGFTHTMPFPCRSPAMPFC